MYEAGQATLLLLGVMAALLAGALFQIERNPR
jgi:hypothetical protein